MQFIGRFARTNDPEIAGATFVAYPNEQRDEIQELWTTSAIWPDIVHNVSSLRIEREEFAQQVLETFETQATDEVKDIPLASINPFFHAKVFRCFGDVDLNRTPAPTYEKQVLRSSFSDEFNVLVLVRRYVRKPKWIDDPKLEDSVHHLDVLYFDKEQRLLFIGSTDKGTQNYRFLVELVTDGQVSALPAAHVNRALNDIEGLTFFNLGIFNDDGAGEAADLVSLTPEGGSNVLRLYHCKASSEHTAGSRLKDLYDVCGQSIRSGIWTSGARLVDRLDHRLHRTSVKGLVKGTIEDLRRAFSASQRHNLRFEIVIVQPGISESKLREMPEQLLVTTKHSALAAGFGRFCIIGSK